MLDILAAVERAQIYLYLQIVTKCNTKQQLRTNTYMIAGKMIKTILSKGGKALREEVDNQSKLQSIRFIPKAIDNCYHYENSNYLKFKFNLSHLFRFKYSFRV